MVKAKVRCVECGALFTEIYPEGFDSDESYSDPEDPKPCQCNSQYEILPDKPKQGECFACRAPANCYGLFCEDCMERLRKAADKVLSEFQEAMESAPHDAMEEGCLVDDLIVKIITPLRSENTVEREDPS